MAVNNEVTEEDGRTESRQSLILKLFPDDENR